MIDLKAECDRLKADLAGRGVPDGLVEALREASAFIDSVRNGERPTIRYPMADELDGFAAMLAAAPQPPAQPAHEGRSDAEIIAQTEEVAALLALTYGGSVIAAGATYRESNHPKAQRCWDTACKIQEILTATDVENALADDGVAFVKTAPPAQPERKPMTDSEMDQTIFDCGISRTGKDICRAIEAFHNIKETK